MVALLNPWRQAFAGYGKSVRLCSWGYCSISLSCRERSSAPLLKNTGFHHVFVSFFGEHVQRASSRDFSFRSRGIDMQIPFTFFTRCFYSPQHSTAFFPGNQIRLSINSRSSSLANLPPDMHPLASNLGIRVAHNASISLKRNLEHKIAQTSPQIASLLSIPTISQNPYHNRARNPVRLPRQIITTNKNNATYEPQLEKHRMKKKFWNSFQVSRILKTISKYKTILPKKTSCSLRGKENPSAAFTYQVLCMIDIRLRSVLLFRKQISLPAPDSRQRIHTKPTTELARSKILLKSGPNRDLFTSIGSKYFPPSDVVVFDRRTRHSGKEIGRETQGSKARPPSFAGRHSHKLLPAVWDRWRLHTKRGYLFSYRGHNPRLIEAIQNPGKKKLFYFFFNFFFLVDLNQPAYF